MPNIFSANDIRFERIWIGEAQGMKLHLEHISTGILVIREIGFDEESSHRRELLAELSHRVTAEFPDTDFRMEHMECGPEVGATLQLVHIPTALSVHRAVGYEPQGGHEREMIVELLKRLVEREKSGG